MSVASKIMLCSYEKFAIALVLSRDFAID